MARFCGGSCAPITLHNYHSSVRGYLWAAQAERKSKIALTPVKDGRLVKTRAATPGGEESGGGAGMVVPGALLAGAALLLGR